MVFKKYNLPHPSIYGDQQNDKNTALQETEPPIWMFWKRRRFIVVLLMFFGVSNVFSARIQISMGLNLMLSEQKYKDENGTFYTEREFDWDDQIQGYILSGYFYGCILTMFLGGVLAPLLGAHHLLGIGVGMSNIMIILTPIAARQGLWLLIINQVLTGAFGGIMSPCTASLLSKWIPSSERSRMVAITFSGQFFGLVIASYGCGLLGTYFKWEITFYIFGSIGVLWWLIWIICITDDPKKDKRCTKAEVDFINDSNNFSKDNQVNYVKYPWRKMFTSMPFLGLVAATFAGNTSFFTIITLLPKYLKDMYNFSTKQIGLLTAICYAISWLLTPFGGILADKLQEKILTTTQVRKYFTCFTFLTQIIFFTLVGNIQHSIYTPILLIIGTSIMVFSWPGYMANSLDLSPTHSSFIVGISCTIGILPGVICPTIAGYILSNAPVHYSFQMAWSFVFYMINLILFIGGAIYWFTVSGELQDWE